MWKTLGCAVKGTCHIAGNIPCQDKISNMSANGVDAIALADGAGSARFSHFGARTVTDYICRKLCYDFDSIYSDFSGGINAKTMLVSEITQCLRSTASEHNCSEKDLASTLLAVAVRGEDVIAVHLGDGVIGCITNDEIKVLSSPENGEYANTTVFTTSKHAISSIKFLKGHIKDKIGFVLMSDGSCASLYNKRENRLSDGIRSFIREGEKNKATALNEMLIESFKYDIRSRTNDDCSIAILYKDPETFSGYLNLPFAERNRLLGVNSFSRLYRDSDKIISLVSSEKGKSMEGIIRWMHKKPSRIKMTVRRLGNCDLIYEKDGMFRPIIKTSHNENDCLHISEQTDKE